MPPLDPHPAPVSFTRPGCSGIRPQYYGGYGPEDSRSCPSGALRHPFLVSGILFDFEGAVPRGGAEAVSVVALYYHKLVMIARSSPEIVGSIPTL